MAGFLSTSGPDPTVMASNAANANGLQQAGQAYSNYRQFSRDNYANQLANQSSLYQGLMNRIASGYGQQGAPNVSQMSYNPMSLAQTTVGSTHGSNAMGKGVDFYGGGEDANGNVNQDAYGLIGQMGLEGQGKWANASGGNSGITPTLNQYGLPYVNGGINTNNVAPPTGPVASQPQQFSFAPRRP